MNKFGTEHLSDEELIVIILTGSVEKFCYVVERYQQKLFRYVLAYVRDQDQAEDIVQDAFIQMYKNLHSFDVERKFSPWAYRVTHNVMMTTLRKHKHDARSTRVDEWYPETVDNRPSLEEALETKLSNERLHLALAKLAMKYRQALVLYYFEGCDYKTMASIMDVPVSTVSTRINRAKNHLQKQLTKERKRA